MSKHFFEQPTVQVRICQEGFFAFVTLNNIFLFMHEKVLQEDNTAI